MNFRLLQYILERRKLIIAVTAVFALAAAIYVILADPSYESRALIMPPLEEGDEGLLTAWMAQLNLPSMIVPKTAGSTTAAILVDILGSRRLGETVIETHSLKEWYGAGSMDEAFGELRARTSLNALQTGMISIKLRDRDPFMARRLVTAYINCLDSLNTYFQFTRAENTMRFVGGQIDKYRAKLSETRSEMADFQQKNGIIDFEEQLKGVIEVAASLKVKASIAEIELDLLREYAREDAVELKRKEAEYNNLKLQLQKIMEGDSSSTVFPPLSRMPVLYQRYAALQRDLEVNEKVYSFLLERYEEAGIDRARNTPTVQVVDMPNLPERRAGIPRAAVIVIAAAAGFLWTCIMLAWWGWITMSKRDAEEEKAFSRILEIAREDLLALKRRLRL